MFLYSNQNQFQSRLVSYEALSFAILNHFKDWKVKKNLVETTSMEYDSTKYLI